MNEETQAPAEKNPDEEAVFRPSRWPGLIWAVPVAALAIIAWLGFSALAQQGPSVEVSFPVTGGLKAGNTKVEYNNYIVGHIGDVTLTKSLGQMKVKINFNASMSGHLGPGTRYWIAGGSFSLSDLSNIKNMISGPVIGVDPRPGKTVHKAQGLATPPVIKTAEPGLTLTLSAPTLPHISAGSPVFYKGYKLGKVVNVTMSPDGSQFTIQIFIDSPWQKLVRENSRFWNAGAVRISSGAGGPGIELQSVPALLTGAIAFETPSTTPAPAAPNGMHFKLYNSKSEAQYAPGSGAVLYSAIFPGGPHGLAAGATVQLEGSPAGAVTKVSMHYDPAQHSLATQVTLALQPQSIGLANSTWNLANPGPQMNAMLASLISQGLRAEISSNPPIVGGKIISLTMVKDAPPAALQPGAIPQIPSFGSGGGDVSGIVTQINSILASVNAMPLDQIASNIHTATKRLAALAKSPQTKQTLRHLDRTMAHVDAITREANAQLPAILAAVRQSATQAQATLTAAQGLLSSQGPSNASPESSALPQTLYQLSQAAKSLQQLANFLDSHPGALIAGRKD